MLQNVNNPAVLKHQVNNMDSVLMKICKTVYPMEEKKAGQCRFMMFIRLRPGVISHFKDLKRTGYYPGDKYTDKEPEMLRNLLKMLDKRLSQYDYVAIYDNSRSGEERQILEILDDCIKINKINLYSLMLTNYILPKWLHQS